MHTFKCLSVLALAATTAFAAPAPVDGNAIAAREPGRGYWGYGNRWYYRGGNQPDATVTAVVTVTGYGDDWSLPTGTSEPETTPADVQPEITSAPAPAGNWGGYNGGSNGGWSSPSAAAVPATPAPSSAPSTPSTQTPSTGGGGDWFTIASKWRAALGKPAWTVDSKLVANAQDTADSSGGNLVHKLNPGSFAQVLAPGDASDFESVFLGGWLCELPNLPGLNGICSSASGGWNHDGQTGHAEILSSTQYTKIGCALGDGIWSCDLA